MFRALCRVPGSFPHLPRSGGWRLPSQVSRTLCRVPGSLPRPQEWGLGPVLLLFGFRKREDMLKGIASSCSSLSKQQWKDRPASKLRARGSILQVKPPGSPCVPVMSQDRTELLVSIDVLTSQRTSGVSLTPSSYDQTVSLLDPRKKTPKTA